MNPNELDSLDQLPTHRGTLPNDDISLGDRSTAGGGSSSAPLDDFGESVVGVELTNLADRYEILGPLGRGGMGEVLKARDKRLGRVVAIKRVRADLAGHRGALARFLAEARAVAGLSHFNIVQLHDYGHDAVGPYFVMEYVDGGTLLDKLRDGPLTLEKTINLGIELCEALAKAHGQGIIHRDIKPANILLTVTGEAKLTDFGLARQDTGDDHGHTRAGTLLGTLDYMSPEQRRNASNADQRSDLWSLAATLYQAVTGRSPRVLRLDLLASGMRNVLGRALEENPDERYQDAAALKVALQEAREIEPLNKGTPVQTGTQEGECQACQTINPIERRFCKKCGENLREPCLKCGKTIGTWEQFCPKCGASPAKMIIQVQEEINLELSRIDELAREQRFDEALQVIKQIKIPEQRAFIQFRERLTVTGQEIDNLQSQWLIKKKIESLKNDIRTIANYRLEYRFDEALAALHLLDIPKGEEYERYRLWAAQTTSQITNDQTMWKKKSSETKDVIKEMLSKREYWRVGMVAETIPLVLQDSYFIEIREQAGNAIRRAEKLQTDIKRLYAAKDWIQLLQTIDEYFELVGVQPKILALRTQVEERIRKAEEKSRHIISKLKELPQDVEFDQMIRLARLIPPECSDSAKLEAAEIIEIRFQQISGIQLSLTHRLSITSLDLGPDFLRFSKFAKPITDKVIKHLVDLASLTSLHLSSYGPISSFGMIETVGLYNLNTLDVSFNDITDAGLAQIGKLVNLTSLTIGSRQITDNGLADVAKLVNLTNLELLYCKAITDAGLGHVAKLTNLTKLRIHGSGNVTDRGLICLNTLLKLKELILSSCKNISSMAPEFVKRSRGLSTNKPTKNDLYIFYHPYSKDDAKSEQDAAENEQLLETLTENEQFLENLRDV